MTGAINAEQRLCKTFRVQVSPLDTARFVFEHEKIEKLFLTFQGLTMIVDIEVLSEQIWYIKKRELL